MAQCFNFNGNWWDGLSMNWLCDVFILNVWCIYHHNMWYKYRANGNWWCGLRGIFTVQCMGYGCIQIYMFYSNKNDFYLKVSLKFKWKDFYYKLRTK